MNNISEFMGYPITKSHVLSDGQRKNPVVPTNGPVIVGGIAYILCLKGTYILKINGKECKLEKNTLLTITFGSVCESIEYSDDTLIEYVFLSPELMYELDIPMEINLLKKFFLFPVLKLTDEKFSSIWNLFQFMTEHYRRNRHLYWNHLAKNLLASFITEVCDLYNRMEDCESGIPGRKTEIYRQFFKLLLENVKYQRSVQFYADKICVSAKYLSQLIKEISGKPVIEWINELTIINIKSILKTTVMSVSQISDEMNFSNSSFLGRYFKKHTGITPLQYRETKIITP